MLNPGQLTKRRLWREARQRRHVQIQLFDAKRMHSGCPSQSVQDASQKSAGSNSSFTVMVSSGDTVGVVVASMDDRCEVDASWAATKIAAPANAHTPTKRIGFSIFSPAIELSP
jgi:hypothetical protein